jgi:hypothetical protein
MDYALEQLINGPAGSRPVLDVVMTIVAGGADVIFMALVAGWFLMGMLRRHGGLVAVQAMHREEPPRGGPEATRDERSCAPRRREAPFQLSG